MEKQIKIKKLNIRNFNGIASVDLNFKDGINQIISPSGLGKSSLIQAIQYVCGIDVQKIYPSIDEFVIKDLETEVELNLEVDGINYTLIRKSKQKWSVDKLTGEKNFKGNETTNIFDDIECTATNYKEKVCSLFNVDYKKLPILLDIAYFNSLHWEDQRKTLTELLDLDKVVSNLNESDQFNLLHEDLIKGKSEVDIQKILNTIKKSIESEQTKNQILITDKGNQVAELSKTNFEEIENRKVQIRQEIEKLQNQNKEANKNSIIETKKVELENARAEYSKVKLEISRKESEHLDKVTEVKRKIYNINNDIDYETRKIKRIDSELEDLKMELTAVNEEEFDNSKTICPTCKRELQEEKIKELLSNFEVQKEKRIKEINFKAENQAIEKQNCEKRLNTLNESKNDLEAELEGLNKVEFDKSELQTLSNKCDAIYEEIEAIKEKEVENIIVDKIKELNEEYDNCVRELTKKDLIQQIQNEVQIIKDKNRELAIQDRDRILKQNQLFEYIKQKIAIVNKTVNENFDEVEFIFFTPLTSNAEKPYEITCSVTYQGVKYAKLSTGQKILANCKVFEGLCKLLKVDMFKFVDERQSTTLDLNIKGQIIELITSKSYEEQNFKPSQIKEIYTISDTNKSEF